MASGFVFCRSCDPFFGFPRQACAHILACGFEAIWEQRQPGFLDEQ